MCLYPFPNWRKQVFASILKQIHSCLTSKTFIQAEVQENSSSQRSALTKGLFLISCKCCIQQLYQQQLAWINTRGNGGIFEENKASPHKKTSAGLHPNKLQDIFLSLQRVQRIGQSQNHKEKPAFFQFKRENWLFIIRSSNKRNIETNRDKKIKGIIHFPLAWYPKM